MIKRHLPPPHTRRHKQADRVDLHIILMKCGLPDDHEMCEVFREIFFRKFSKSGTLCTTNVPRLVGGDKWRLIMFGVFRAVLLQFKLDFS